ncbi:MAG: ChrR family anti-sigma-E factor [Pseudomonadota bacterium]
MSIKHHLDSATIFSYAAGTLPASTALVASAHIDQCDVCRKHLRKAETLGAFMFEENCMESLSPSALSTALQHIDNEQQDDPKTFAFNEVEFGHRLLPRQLRNILIGDERSIRWQPVAPGIKRHMLELQKADHGKLYLLKLAPGRSVPKHGHGGSELTLVLAGSYTDEFGHFRAGDIADLDGETAHQPIADPVDGCICLVASEEPARFSGVMARVAQPFIGV